MSLELSQFAKDKHTVLRHNSLISKRELLILTFWLLVLFHFHSILCFVVHRFDMLSG